MVNINLGKSHMTHFCNSSRRFRDKSIKMCDLEKLGQGYTVQHLQWSHSMANISLYKVTVEHFSLALTVFEIFTFHDSWPWKCRSRSWCTAFAVVPYDCKNPTSYLMTIVKFAFFQRLFVKGSIWKVRPWKLRSRSLITTFAMAPFDGKCRPL